MSFLNKLFGDANEKYIKSLQPTIERINELEKDIEKLSAEEIKGRTALLKERLHPPAGGGETLDDILPEAFSLVREAGKRTLGQRHFDCQLIGGIVLHQGKISEMRTGEGKTLSATLPLYLNALEGKGCHLVTVNDYLTKRDTIWMGQIYNYLGITVGCITHDQAFLYDPEYKAESTDSGLSIESADKERDEVGSFKIIESFLRPVERREAYLADITYGTNNEFGFDYLKDNMVYETTQMSQRGFNFAIVDEVDSILIDEARTPLIISAPDEEAASMYNDFAKITPILKKETDYEIDEKMKAATLTDEGINKIEKILNVGNMYEEKGIRYWHDLEQALRAEVLFKNDKDYVVKSAPSGGGEVIIIDEFTGRLMPGRRWSGGLHQAIEAKEGVHVQPESLTLATVTFQNYFRMYKKLAGMTGTAATSAEEFDKVYKLDVIVVPTNKPITRKDLPDCVYRTEQGKFQAVIQTIKERHEAGQPILVGTRSVERNEFLGKLLEREGIPHTILNAKYHEKEGEIIAQAGKFGSVTIATNMAGRGVDIILGGNPPDEKEAEKVKNAGGLFVIGTERHEARRIDNQLQGRAGRQGDPGATQFFVSLEDELLRVFGSDRIKSLMSMLKIPEDQPIQAKLVSGAIESAQSKIEGFNFDVRKNVLDYDDVMNKHREVIYKKRRDILQSTPEELKEKVAEIALQMGFKKEDFENKEKEVGAESMRKIERIVSLRTLDMLWMEHLEEMESVRDSVRLRAYGQQDPLVEYKGEAHRAFQKLLENIEVNTVNTILKSTLVQQKKPETPIESFGATQDKKNQSTLNDKNIGRNDPCPCGSGKKYKKCHGK